MAVTVDTQLPAQPADGVTKYIPLGGDGFRSPRMLCRVNSLATGDASGGAITQVIRMDPSYSSVVAWVRMVQDDNTTIIMTAAVIPDNEMGASFQVMGDNLDGYSGSNEAFAAQSVFVPPPIILSQEDGTATPPTITCDKVNVDTKIFRVSAEIYMFDKRAREVGQAEDLLALIGRGGQRFYANT